MLVLLHPELVREHQDNKGRYIYSDTIVCNECMSSIEEKKKPERSIANGINFGSHYRVNLEQPSLREMQIIAKVRHYYNIIKLKSSSRYLQQHYQSSIK